MSVQTKNKVFHASETRGSPITDGWFQGILSALPNTTILTACILARYGC
jgi:hypothetical protein